MFTADFLSTIWGIIGVLVLVILGVMVILGVITMARSFTSRHRNAIILGEDQTARVPTHFRLGEFQRIKGTRYVISAYVPSYLYKGSFSGYSEDAVRNYLFVEMDKQTSHYLMPTNAQLVILFDMLGIGEATSKFGPVQWLYCHIVDTDTNNDGRLTEEDGFSVAFANPDGSQLVPVLKGVTKMMGRIRINGNAMLLLYSKEGVCWMSEIDIAQRSVVRTQELLMLS